VCSAHSKARVLYRCYVHGADTTFFANSCDDLACHKSYYSLQSVTTMNAPKSLVFGGFLLSSNAQIVAIGYKAHSRDVGIRAPSDDVCDYYGKRTFNALH